MLSLIQRLSEPLGLLKAYDKAFAKLWEQCEGIHIELRDMLHTLQSASFEEIKEEERQRIEDRLSIIYDLEKKHHVKGSSALLSIQGRLLSSHTNAKASKEALDKQREILQSLQQKMERSAESLSDRRQACMAPFCQQVLAHIGGLGMPDARFVVQRKATSPSASGIDEVTFMFSANKGMGVQRLSQVASGGEYSRLMCVMKYLLAEKQAMPTLLFDEIDLGLSGASAERMIHMLKAISKNHQILLISHVASFASKADTHFMLEKKLHGGRTTTNLRRLEDKERTKALAQMMEGERPSVSAMETAENMRKRG